MADNPFSRRPVYVISVAAQLAAMHPQTLRLYERRGLLTPTRLPNNRRLYSDQDVQRLRRIQELTDLGLNLAGVERVLAMEEQIEDMRREMMRMRDDLAAAAQRLKDEVARAQREHRRDLVPVPRAAIVSIRRKDQRDR